jgi:hypothetical protein
MGSSDCDGEAVVLIVSTWSRVRLTLRTNLRPIQCGSKASAMTATAAISRATVQKSRAIIRASPGFETNVRFKGGDRSAGALGSRRSPVAPAHG